jgi:aspartyl/asparaginyl beta-hydroxylase (cupin superfamily)
MDPRCLLLCRIFIVNKNRWNDGENFVFDENNLHFVVNDGPGRRLVFNVDFPRPNLPLRMRIINEVLLRYVT